MSNREQTKWDEKLENLWRNWNNVSIEQADKLQRFISQLLAEQRKELEDEFAKTLELKKNHYKLREILVIKEIKNDLLNELQDKIQDMRPYKS